MAVTTAHFHRARRGVTVLTLALALPAVAAAAGPRDTRLADAAMQRDTATVRTLLGQKGIDVNAPGRDGTPALHWTVRVNDLDTVSALMRAGADPKLATRYGVTPMSLAAANGNAAMVKLLLEGGADANTPDGAGETPLMSAAKVGSLDTVKALLAGGAVLDAPDQAFQQTALMVAIRANHPELVRFFIQQGASVNARTRTGETPRWVLPNSVPGFGHGIGIIRGGLPERGSRYLIPGAMTPLMYAARDGRLDTARSLLDAGARIDDTDANGVTPLLAAIANNHPDVARLLIDRGADIKTVDWYGRTPLWTAVEVRNMDIDNNTFANSVDRAPLLDLIRILLDKGADPNVRTKESPPIRRQMLTVTGTLEWVDFTGQTPFIRAALAGDVSVMKLLLAHGADPKVTTFGGTSALMAAAGVNWVVDQTADEGAKALLDAVQMCLDLGLDVNAVNSMGLTAVHGAANRGSDDIIRLLASKGARLDIKDKEGRTPKAWAEGVFLATHPARPKPSSIALLTSLTANATPTTASTRP
jgi:ankyrin repeat protein